MAPKQATLGKFFGAKGSKPEPQQSKLSFATKTAPKKEVKKEEDAPAVAVKEEKATTKPRKRTRSPSPAVEAQSPKVRDEATEDDEDEPATKRPRRARKRVIEEDEDEVMDEAPVKSPTTSPKPSRARKSSPVKSAKASKAKPDAPKANRLKRASKSPSPAPAVKDEKEGITESASEDDVGEDDEEESKPAVAKKTLEEVQMKLKTQTKDPYPDWKQGEPVPYAALCTTFSLIELTTKRLEIMAHCSLFLRQVLRLTPDDLLPTVLLMINKLAPDYAGIELGIGESLIMKAIGETTGRSLAVIKQDQKEIGDLGLVAVKSRSTQPTMFKPKALTIRGVHNGLMGIATVSGNGAQGRKVDAIKKLFEAKYLVRFLEGKLRLGLAEKSVLVSLAQAVVFHEANAKGQVPKTTDVEQAEATLKTVYSATLIHDSELPSYDAAANGVASIFSRNSEDLSKKYPDILAKLHTWVKEDTKSFVLDCETVAWDVDEKKVLPFQQLMTRKKKDVKIEDVKVKVCVFAFDLLYLNGEAIVEKSLRERRELLENAFQPVEGEFSFATHMDGQELEQIQVFLDESVKASCEGLMVKMLDGSESGYEPSKRSRNWLKIKKDYLSGIGDSLDLVVLGAYHGKGKRTSVYGAFLLACYNPSSESYETVCNIGTGFSEAVLEELHKQLSDIVIDRPKPFYAHSSGGQHQPDVWFEPRYVWEVKTADLTLSPRYKAGCKEGVDPGGEKGISLRFPRFIKVRDDKKPDEATSSRQVAEMYRKQESVTKNKGPAADDDFEY
ncbi:DNA ligase 1 [Colletotrichum liriopes]|uniref:DNA ligase 1 n=1 Tax=Colletotrichum liriopes TaxID=708192 RepID=A0AA37H2Q6_9PEZI|nr:DNA ligase 1 [Colletotrichum liriopes]